MENRKRETARAGAAVAAVILAGAAWSALAVAAIRIGGTLFGSHQADLAPPLLFFPLGLLLGAAASRWPPASRLGRLWSVIRLRPVLLAIVAIFFPAIVRFFPPGDLVPRLLYVLLAAAAGFSLGAYLPRLMALPAEKVPVRLGLGAAGASAGLFVATGALVPSHGSPGAAAAAALLFVAAGAASLGDRPFAGRPREETVENPAGRPPVYFVSLLLLALLFGLSISALGRLVALILGPTFRVAGLFHALLLAGLFAAVLVARALFRRRSPAAPSAAIALGGGLLLVLLIPLAARFPVFYVDLARGRADDPATIFRIRLLLAAASALPLAIPAGALGALLAGALFRKGGGWWPAGALPLAAAATAAGLALAPRLFPSIGVHGLLVLSALLYLGTGVLLLAASGEGRLSRRLPAALLLAVLLAGIAVNPPRRRHGFVNSGPYRFARVYGRMEKEKLEQNLALLPAYCKDGTRKSVFVAGAPGSRFLMVNGMIEASDGGYLPLEVLLARLPLLFRPEAKNALLLGAGAGVTLGRLLRSDLEEVVVVDDDEASFEAIRYFGRVNREPWNERRARFVRADPPAALTGAGRYDIIAGRLFAPWDVGELRLATAESYALAASHLAPGGVFAACLPAASLREEHLRTLLRTFRDAFPYVVGFRPPQVEEIILLGSAAPLALDAAALLEAWKDHGIEADLRAADLRSPYEIVPLLRFGGPSLDRYVEGTRANGDGLRRVEFETEFSAAVLTGGKLDGVLRSLHPNYDALLRYEGLDAEDVASFDYEVARAFRRDGYGPGGLFFAARAYAARPAGPVASLYGHFLKSEAGNIDSALAVIRPAWEEDRESAALARQFADYAFSGGRFEECERFLTEVIAGGLDEAWCYVLRGKARLALGKNEEGLEDLRKGKELDRLQDRTGDINYYLGVAYKNLGKIAESQGMIGRALHTNPRHVYARYEFGENELLQGKIDRKAFEKEYLMPFNRARAESLFERAEGRLYEPQHAEEVERDLRAVINTTPNHFGAYLLLAEFYGRRGEADRERRVLRRMLEQLGRRPEVTARIKRYLRATGGGEKLRSYGDLLR